MKLNNFRDMSDRELYTFINNVANNNGRICCKCGKIVFKNDRITLSRNIDVTNKKICCLCKSCYSNLLEKNSTGRLHLEYDRKINLEFELLEILNDKVEILDKEDEFIDNDEEKLKELLFNELDTSILRNYVYDLIKNQKLIIEKLKEKE